MTTPAPATQAQIFQQLAALIANQTFQAAGPVITAALSQVSSNPQTVLNPLNSGLFVAKFIADMTATLPVIENSAVAGIAQLAQALITSLTSQFATAPVTATQIGTEIGSGVAAVPVGGA